MSLYAAKLADLADYVTLNYREIIAGLSIYWVAGYLPFFFWMGIVEYNRGLSEIPHSFAVLVWGFIGTVILSFYCISKL